MFGLPLSVACMEIVKSSSYVDLLDENNLIMADQGFDIQDLLASKKVTLFIPPKRQSTSEQFSKEDFFNHENCKCKNTH